MSEKIDNIKITYLGNCGRVHQTAEEWRDCRTCDTPRPPTPEWRAGQPEIFLGSVERK